MKIYLAKYKTLLLIKAFLIICFLALSIACPSQQDTVRTGRLSDIDTTILPEETIESSDVDEGNADEDEGAEKDEKEHFFSLKSAAFPPDSFALRTLNDSAVRAMKNDKNFWYVDKAFPKKKNQDSYSIPFWLRPGFQSFIWIVIIIAFVGFLIMYLKEGSVSLFRKTKAIAEDEEKESDENIFVINYQREIDKSIAAGDYRMATRLMYLRMLKNLSEKGYLQYTPDKTNFDYLVEASSRKWYHLFFNITRHYEYAWYGQFDVNSDTFEMIRNEFINFEKQV